MSISQTLQNSLSSRKNVWICSRSNLAMIKKSKFSSLILPGTKNQDCGHLSSILHMKALQRKLKKLNQDFWVGSLGIFVSFHDLLKIVMLFPRKLINKNFYDYLLLKIIFQKFPFLFFRFLKKPMLWNPRISRKSKGIFYI